MKLWFPLIFVSSMSIKEVYQSNCSFSFALNIILYQYGWILEQALWSNFHSLSFTCTRLYYLHLLQLVCSYFFLLFSAKVSYDKLFDTIKWSFVFSIKVQFSSSSKLGQIGPYGVQGQIWKTKFVRPSLTFLYHL